MPNVLLVVGSSLVVHAAAGLVVPATITAPVLLAAIPLASVSPKSTGRDQPSVPAESYFNASMSLLLSE